jgi:EmrB/QacA subfamily drug resistance transporter
LADAILRRGVRAFNPGRRDSLPTLHDLKVTEAMPPADSDAVQSTTASPPRAAVSTLLPYIVAATFFMEYLDTTIIATALPQMARSFAVGPNEVSLGMTAYMLTLAVFIPISGWIADCFGSRTVFGAALVIFTVASMCCGLSVGIASFTAARVLQGIGGAMMVPVGRMIVVRNTGRDRLMKAIATITWPAIVAPVIGPSIGGFITTYASWHWIFFLNVPFAIAAFIAIVLVVPNQRDGRRRPLDLVGFVLSGAALIAILYGTELASHRDADVTVAVGLMAAGIVIGALALRHLRRARHPLLDPSTLGVPTFAVTVQWGSATRIGIEAVPYLLPLLFQLGFGLSAFQSGLLLLASALGNLGMKFFTTPILRFFGFRTVSIVTVTTAGLFTVACGWLAPSTPLPLLLLVLFVYGLARSLQFTTLGTLAYADVNDAQKGPASTLWSVAQQMTIGMGIAFGALCLRLSAALHPSDAGAAHFTVGDFRWAFLAAGLLTLVSLIGYARLPRSAGSAIGGGRGNATAQPKEQP